MIVSFRKLQTEEKHIHIKFHFTFDKIGVGTLEMLKLPFKENIHSPAISSVPSIL
jgi:hypothetical protein